MTWLTTPPPKDGKLFLADIGYPWPALAAWNESYKCWICAEFGINVRVREYAPYFEQADYDKDSVIKRWMPMPELK